MIFIRIFWPKNRHTSYYAVTNFSKYAIYRHARLFHKGSINELPRENRSFPNTERPVFNSKKLDHSSLIEHSEFPTEDSDIFGIESDEGAICFDENVPPNLEKYRYLVERRNKEVKTEVVHVTSFGQIRRDDDNLPFPRGTYRDRLSELNLQSLSKTQVKRNLENSSETDFKNSKLDKLVTKKEALHLYRDTTHQLQNTFHSDHSGSDHNIKNKGSVLDPPDYHISESLQDHKVENSSYIDEHYFEDIYSNSGDLDTIDVSKHYVGKTSIETSSNECFTHEMKDQHSSGDEKSSDFSYVDECYFQNVAEASVDYNSHASTIIKSKTPVQNVEVSNTASDKLYKKSNQIMHQETLNDLNYIDEYYFNDPAKEFEKTKHDEEPNVLDSNDLSLEKHFTKPSNVSKHATFNKMEINDLSQQDTGFTQERQRKEEDLIHEKPSTLLFDDNCVIKRNTAPNIHNNSNIRAKEQNSSKTEELNYSDDNNLTKFAEHWFRKKYMQKDFNSSVKETIDEPKTSKISLEGKMKMEDKNTSARVRNEKESSDEVKSAMDYVLKLKKATQIRNSVLKGGDLTKVTGEILDSKGFRILKNQVPDLSKLTHEELLAILKDAVLYENDDVMVLNKPYNLIIHDAKTNKEPCLSVLLNDLARMLNSTVEKPELFTVHRLDKETTGCLLLAKNEITAQLLKSLFAQEEIIKTYWVVTSRIPDPLEGVIDIPITEGRIGDKTRMVLSPVIPKDVRYKSHAKHGKRAVTHYKVISTSGNAALVEVKPVTGIKHQIRVHFGFGLGCPILGDHKYSHLDKLAPQKLPSDLLQKLHVRQSKVRYIPLHIHARSIIVPKILNGMDLFASAPLSHHMVANLRRLKFRKK